MVRSNDELMSACSAPYLETIRMTQGRRSGRVDTLLGEFCQDFAAALATLATLVVLVLAVVHMYMYVLYVLRRSRNRPISVSALIILCLCLCLCLCLYLYLRLTAVAPSMHGDAYEPRASQGPRSGGGGPV
jgi:hypothetical protein